MKIATERYRLALIAHHAEKLVELVREQNNYGSSAFVCMPIHYIEGVIRNINNYLIKEENNG